MKNLHSYVTSSKSQSQSQISIPSKYIILNFPTLDLLVLNEDYKNVFDVAYPILYTLTLSRCCGT